MIPKRVIFCQLWDKYNMVRKLLILILILVFFGVFYGLYQQIDNSLGAGNRLKEAKDEVEKLKSENTNLKNQLKNIQSLTFLEKTARDRLLLSKPNETIVIINQKRIDEYLASGSATTKEVVPYWRGWLNLFLN